MSPDATHDALQLVTLAVLDLTRAAFTRALITPTQYDQITKRLTDALDLLDRPDGGAR